MKNAVFDNVEVGENWTMTCVTMKMPLQIKGKVEIHPIYSIGGMVMINRHLYLYVCQLHNPSSVTKSNVKQIIRAWLDSLEKANAK